MGIKLVKIPDFVKKAREMREARKEALGREMLFARTEIIGRSQRGRDFEDVPFVEYSKGYAKWKSDKGRQVDTPDLTFSGDMMRAIQTTVEERPQSLIGKLYFAGAGEAAKARAIQRLRKFFALSIEQIQRIIRAINDRQGRRQI